MAPDIARLRLKGRAVGEEKNVQWDNQPISKELLSELQSILEQDYGQKLTLSEVSEIGVLLIRYFDILATLNSGSAKTKKNV